MTFSAFDHPYLSALVGDDEVAGFFTVEAEIEAMLVFESALARAESRCGLIPAAAAAEIEACCKRFRPEVDRLRAGIARDGVVVPELVKHLRETLGDDARPHLHMGATSQDVIDTALVVRLKSVCEILLSRLVALRGAMEKVEETFGRDVLMGHTRMQAAIPITVADRVRAWREPLDRHAAEMKRFEATGLVIQFGGAAGTLEKLGDKAEAVRRTMAEELGLSDAPQWQSQRDRVAGFGSLLSLLTGSLGKFGQDIALLAQAGNEISLAGGGASSAMAHKQNPVAAEVLVTLARYNASQVGGLHQALVHEQERSGAAWTLEWMSLPSMIACAGASLRLGERLVGDIHGIGREA